MNKKKISDGIGLIVSKDNSPVPINDEQYLRLDLMEGWDLLQEPMQRFLQEYARNPFNEKLICMQLGYPLSRLTAWKSTPEFVSIIEAIDDIYTEIMLEADYRDSLTNAKIRGRHLKSRKARGFEEEKKEPSKHLHFHISNFSNKLNQ